MWLQSVWHCSYGACFLRTWNLAAANKPRTISSAQVADLAVGGRDVLQPPSLTASHPVQVILQLQQLWTVEELVKKCRSVALLHFLACLWLQWEQQSFRWSVSVSEILLWSNPGLSSVPWQMTVLGAAGCVFTIWQRTKSCAFSLLQSRRNIELRNGIVQGHAYTITGAVKVRSGTCSCLEILYWWSTTDMYCCSSRSDLD